ncbi:MAG: hypothetical protein ISR52_10515 [Rhodospirillales bacterium]|nr:hypothetical protein [Rhodospirillales bacterium]
MPFSLILDILVAVLLIVTICYAMMLNRKLSGLRRDKSELEQLASTFAQSTVRAEESLNSLKNNTDGLQERIAKAQTLADDLMFLIDRGTSVADQLEDVVRSARPKKPADKEKNASGTEQHENLDNNKNSAELSARDHGDLKSRARSEAERELLKALQSGS